MKKIIALSLLAAILLCGCKPAGTPSYSGTPAFPDLSDGGTAKHSVRIPEDTARYPSISSSEPSGESGGSPSEIKIPNIPVEKPSASRDLRHITLPLTNDHTNRRVLTIDGQSVTVEVRNGDWVTENVTIDYKNFTKENTGNNSFRFTLDGNGIRKGYLNLQLWDDTGITYRIKHDKEGFSLPDVMDIATNNANVAASPKALTYEQTLKYITKDGTPDNADAVLKKIKTLSDKICRGLRTDYDKLRAISRWVSENIYYDHIAYKMGIPSECLTLEYMLERSSSVCGGYVAMTSALCEAQGITCLHINGDAINQVNCYAEADNGVHHEWNYAVIGNKGIWVDSGWNSRSNLYTNGKYSKDSIAYTYFDIGSEVFALDHKARSAILRNYFPE